MLNRLGQAWAFGRHIPPAQLCRRVQLSILRRIRVRRPPRLGGAASHSTRPTATPPLPVFAPRAGMVALAGPTITFSFLGRAIVMKEGVDWQAPGADARDQLWRMNLHYMEYLEELGPVEAARLMQEWIAANPPWRPGYWLDVWNSYTLSLRVVVWMQQLARHDRSIPETQRAVVIGSLHQQLLFLERHLETDLGGNHLVKNIKALLWASAFFEGRDARRWRRLGMRLLARALDQQILADGVHYERSASYHAQVLADLLEIRHALGEDPLAGRLGACIKAMLSAATDLAHPDGGAILFNDSGLSMAYSPAACAAAANRLHGEANATARNVFAYPQAGYFGLRSDTLFVVADMGPIGPNDLPAHAHGDVGSIELSVAGARLIVDQGVFEYVAGPKRAVARATASHNCLAVEGVDQAAFFGAFRCGRRPAVTVRQWQPGSAGFVLEGSHDGFRHLPGRPIAVRRIDASSDRILIKDWIEGQVDRPLSVGLLLHPDASARQETKTSILVSRDAAAIRIHFPFEATIEPAVYWPDMGRELATSRLRMHLPQGRESEIAIEVVGGGR